MLASVTGAIATAPVAFGGWTSSFVETAAQSVSVGLLGAAVVFGLLGLRWGRRWAV